MGHAAVGNGRATGFHDDQRGLLCIDNRLAVNGNVGEQTLQVNFLMLLGADEFGLHLPGNGEHRRMVELGIVKPVQQVNGARPGGTDTGGQLPGQLGLGRSGKGARFFMADLDEADLLLTTNGIGHVVDGISRNTEQVAHAVGRQHLENHLGNGHLSLLSVE